MTDGFLLTRQWRDTAQGIVLDYWWATPEGPRWTRITQQEAVFFIEQSSARTAARHLQGLSGWRMVDIALRTFEDRSVSAVYWRSYRTAREAWQRLQAQGIAVWEADIRPPERYLMERFITAAATLHLPPADSLAAAAGALATNLSAPNSPLLNPRLEPSEFRPALRMVSLDIETSMDARELYSIALYSQDCQQVFMVGQGENRAGLHFLPDARACLQACFDWLAEQDPDVIIGWNLIQFDCWVLAEHCERLKIPLQLGRGGQSIHWRQDDSDGRRYLTIPGRVALDGIELLKAANYLFDSYALQNIAQVLLGEGKLLTGSGRHEDITRLFHEDKPALAAYNLKDCELVWQIFQEKKLLEFAIERSQLTGLLLDRVGGSVASFEYAYLPRLHRRGYIAPNLGELESDVISPGGYVMDSRPGIYDNVLVLDFKSLYPSIIRTFLIDPCGFWLAQHQKLSDEATVPGFNGAFFAREGHILPDIIAHLWQAREGAKAERNEPLSHAIKIIMNSFYGVLGSPGCRFFDPRVCSSITLRGHDIIQRSREWIEAQGYAVIYGDTDSVFVWLENHTKGKTPKTPEQCRAIGERLARELNVWWREQLQENFQIKSALEIEFETHYLRFLMPTIRGSELGSKKRYAGLVQEGENSRMVFRGLESVRTDWTPLARRFQEALYRKVFDGEDYQDFVRDTAAALLRGDSDEQLVYRKRLRRALKDYQKNVPPHVQAARKQIEAGGPRLGRGDWIGYVLTVNGPEPVDFRCSALDYQHYLSRQLAPVADSILHFSNQSFSALVDQQLSLFGQG